MVRVKCSQAIMVATSVILWSGHWKWCCYFCLCDLAAFWEDHCCLSVPVAVLCLCRRDCTSKHSLHIGYNVLPVTMVHAASGSQSIMTAKRQWRRLVCVGEPASKTWKTRNLFHTSPSFCYHLWEVMGSFTKHSEHQNILSFLYPKRWVVKL